MVRGITLSALLALNTLSWGTPIVLLGAFKLVLPEGRLRRRLILRLADFAERWTAVNDSLFDRLLPTRWEVSPVDGLRADGHYLIISNHSSWVDILVLQRVFHRRVALLRFFIKQELIWFPIVGAACWALDFPFMKRYSAEYLEEHPEKRGSDVATTRKACQRYKTIPVAILNFVEGTRFSIDKRIEQESPYRHLLRPRAGGVAHVIAAMGDQLEELLDVTIAYPGVRMTMWKFLTGHVPRVRVDIRRRAIPPEIVDDAITEPGPERDRFRQWLEAIWEEKDKTLNEMLSWEEG
jgi:1-acyl-sn-glycerol-3-phosphate acyltransferase